MYVTAKTYLDMKQLEKADIDMDHVLNDEVLLMLRPYQAVWVKLEELLRVVNIDSVVGSFLMVMQVAQLV